MYDIKRTVYATGDGTITHDSGEGKNRVVLVLGNSVTQEEADALDLPALDKATDEKEAKAFEEAYNPLAGLKPAASSELKVEDDKTKGAKKATGAPATQEVK